MILLYNFGFGCKVEHDQIRDILRRPVAPAIGACCQFLVMAPLSFGIAMALSLDDMQGEWIHPYGQNCWIFISKLKTHFFQIVYGWTKPAALQFLMNISSYGTMDCVRLQNQFIM